MVEDVGVAIKQIEPDQRHIGLLYKIDGGSLTFCHLAFHHDLRVEAANATYGWLQSGLEDSERRLVASAVAAVVRENPTNEMAYSPNYQATNAPAFDNQTFQYIRGQIGDGLTCATLVLAVFESCGFELLLKSTWELRDDDEEFREKVIAALARQPQDASTVAHIQAIRASPLQVRYRPEEVAAGVGCSDAPLSFARAVEVGRSIIEAIQL